MTQHRRLQLGVRYLPGIALGLRYADFARFTIDVPFHPVLGAISADNYLSGKRLGFDVIGKALNGFGNTRRRFKVDPDAVGDFETRILSHILHAVDELA